MQAQVFRRRNQAPGFGLQEDIKAISECLDPKPIPTPSEDVSGHAYDPEQSERKR